MRIYDLPSLTRLVLLILFVLCVIFIWSPASVQGKGGRGGGGRGSSSGGRGSSGRGSSGRGSSSSGRGSGRGSSSGRSGSRGGSGRISGKSSKSIASGLIGAYAGYKAGRMVGKISSGSSSTYLPRYGRHYYYGSKYYTASSASRTETCRYAIESNDEYFDLTYEDTGARVGEIIYECTNGDTCCNGLDCCSPMSWWLILLIICGAITIFVLTVYCCAKNCRNSETSKPTEITYRTTVNLQNDSTVRTTTVYSPNPNENVQFSASSTSYAWNAQPPNTVNQYQSMRPTTPNLTNDFVPNYTLVGQQTAEAFANNVNLNDHPPSYEKATFSKPMC